MAADRPDEAPLAANDTMPSFEVYREPERLVAQRDRYFARSWQYLADVTDVASEGDVAPVTLLPGWLDEPLLLSHADDGIHCLSNVCTHRANLVVTARGRPRSLRCGYHGRRFALDGTCVARPGFDAQPVCDADHLPRAPLARLGPLLFTALEPLPPLATQLEPVRPRIDALAFDRLVHDPMGDAAYDVRAHWMLYCENYLEGFHIPFVHPALAATVDPGSYRVETFASGVLQTAFARDDADAFDLAPAHPEHGRRVAAYYVWLFPNTMLNCYPWGLSLNVVVPLAVDRTRIVFRSYVLEGVKRGEARGAGNDLDRVETEDEHVVESVAHGVRARLARPGRYAAEHEIGVKHLHTLLGLHAR